MKGSLIFILLFSYCSIALGQDSLKVLFLGNSYTGYNGLANIVDELSDAAGKTLQFDYNVPGGSTIDDHADNATSLSQIQQGDWDFVVLQEQSQVPTIPYFRDNLFFPGVNRIKDSISKYNPCAQVVMFMTWGRQNGGQQCDGTGTYCSPVFADFSHMQDSLESAYVEAALQIDATVAPVGIAWNNVLTDTNLVLHMPDESHPDYPGSYLAGCTIFEVLWDTSVVANTFAGTLTNGLSNYLQQQAHAAVNQPGAPWNLDADPCPSTAGLLQQSTTFHVKLFPNPAIDKITIQAESGSLIEMMDLSGTTVIKQTTYDNSTEVNVESLKKGVYFMRISKENYFKTLRFSKL